ncbi:hypothetical protein IKD82_01285 [Candidatus Saccharibacteria bacterium]|nr:hypothetical protein [Candidatus Saccharibacteria bacterium]
MKKMNLFGKKNDTPGMNLMRVVEGEEQSYGIPPYNYGKMLQIMRNALRPDEIELLCLGFGINTERCENHSAIAKKLGISTDEVSIKGWAAIRKLQDSPYRVQLRKLNTTMTEINRRDKIQTDTIKKLRAEIQQLKTKKSDSDSRELKNVRCRLEATTADLESKKKDYKDLENEHSELQYRYSRREKELKDQGADLEKTRTKLAERTDEAKREHSKAEVAKEKFEKTLKKLEDDLAIFVENVKIDFVVSLQEAEINADTLEVLHLTDKERKALERIHIKDIVQLCRMDFRGLTKMVGKEMALSIEAKLRKVGLALKAA